MIGLPGESLKDLRNQRQRVMPESVQLSLSRGISGGLHTYLAAPATPIRTRVPPLPSGPPGAEHPERRHLPEPRAVEKPSGESGW